MKDYSQVPVLIYSISPGEDKCATVICFSENPPSFSCYRDKGHNNEGIVTYSGCQVITDFMDARSGIFTVKRGGVYRQVQTTSGHNSG